MPPLKASKPCTGVDSRVDSRVDPIVAAIIPAIPRRPGLHGLRGLGGPEDALPGLDDALAGGLHDALAATPDGATKGLWRTADTWGMVVGVVVLVLLLLLLFWLCSSQ
jgi:hypothetical protein